MRLESPAPGPWTLPRLSARIPTVVRQAGVSGQEIAVGLATTLLEVGLADQNDIYMSADASILARRVMTRWWAKNTEGMPLFAWQPSIRTGKEFWNGDDTTPYFCVGPLYDELPHFHIRDGITQLEQECEGLGQTVLALLGDACRYLPYSLTPSGVLGLAQWFYWQGEHDEVAYAKLEVDHGCCDEDTVEQFLQNNEVFKRSEFFQNIPAWLTSPERTCSRDTALASVKSHFAHQVIATCDAISAYGARQEFISHASVSAFSTDVGIDQIAAAFLLSWDDNDSTGRTIDDAFNMFHQGECTQQFAIASIDLEPKKFKRRLREMEESLGLARLVGDLLLLIGARQ